MADLRMTGVRRRSPSGPFPAVTAIAAVGGAAVYVGAYDIGADAPHSRPIYWLIEQFRDRSIAVRARDVVVPASLTDVKRLQSGAGLYTEMCSGCHLAPGLAKTEISQGLYPQAPELFREPQRSAKEQFWVIKHGVKLTAMPAWGKTHSGESIWDMLAFVRQMPKMSAAQYQTAVASAPEDHDAMMKDMPGMAKVVP